VDYSFPEYLLFCYHWNMILCHLCYAQKCVKRIEGDETGQKHCTGQYFDYWKCIDKHVAEKLFDSLK
uniref:Complex III subunit VI n=1 Tax=Aegilops tauschii subsp. strangulata TaxID=200361 RepID=A0A453NWY9_AEGTS